MSASSQASSGAARIAVIGAGAVGGFIAAMLARAGHAVSVVARGAHLEAIREHGLQVTSTGGVTPFDVRVNAVEDPALLGPQDFVFVSLKSYDLPAMAPRLVPLLEADTVLIPVLNGIPWWYFAGLPASPRHAPLPCVDPDGLAATHLSPASIIGCVVHMASGVAEPGVIRHTHGNRFIFGELSGNASARLDLLVTMLAAAGIGAESTPRIRDEIWTKLVGNLSTNPLSALTLGWIDDLVNDPALMHLIRALMTECMHVGVAYGVTFTMDIEKRIEVTRGLGRSKPSMLQDLEKGRRLELGAILEAVAEMGRRAGVPTAHLDVVIALVAERARHLA